MAQNNLFYGLTCDTQCGRKGAVFVINNPIFNKESHIFLTSFLSHHLNFLLDLEFLPIVAQKTLFYCLECNHCGRKVTNFVINNPIFF